jgi:hypothetical protein
MGQFHSTFYSFGRGSDLNSSTFAKYFLQYDADEWAHEGGGSIQYFSDENTVTSLVILQNAQYGIMLSYDCYDKTNKKTLLDCYSVGNPQKMNVIEDIGDDEFFPTGFFLKPEVAWLAVEDFFNNPTKVSERIEWVTSDQIDWLED